MDLGTYDDANLHERLLEYQLKRPAVIEQAPKDTIDRRVMEVQRLAHRAFIRLFTPKKVISEIKGRKNRSEFYNIVVEGSTVIDEFVFDGNDELIAGVRYKAITGQMEVVRVIYKSLEGLGLVLMYKRGVTKLEWDMPENIAGLQLDVNGRMVKDIEDLLKKQKIQDTNQEAEQEIVVI